MSIKEDVEEIKEKTEKLETQSFAMNILEDYKHSNRRMFWVLIITLLMWFSTIGYLVYILNSTGYEIITEEINADTDSGDASGCIRDYCNNG